MRRRLTIGMLAFVASAWLACGDDYGDEARTGERFNPCYANGTCNAGLTCADGLCILLGSDEAGPGDSGTNVTEDGSARDADTATVRKPPPEYVEYLEALCAKQKRCGPMSYEASFADDAACVSYYGPAFAIGYPGTPIPSADQLAACLAAIEGSRCSAVVTELPECAFAGDRKDGAVCNIDSQCAGGACKKASATAACGACASLASADGQCTTIADCKPGLYCKGGQKCAARLPANYDCADDNPLSCQAGLRCTPSQVKCLAPRDLGQSCGEGCRIDLACVSTVCQEYKVAGPGERCSGPSNIQCVATSFCVGPKVDTRACVRAAKEGDACDPTLSSAPLCEPGLTCTNNKCAVPAICQ